MKLIECVPNFSEGRRPEVVTAIREAIASVAGVSILDSSSDESHNRSVITFVAPIDRAVDAAFAGIREAAARIDVSSAAIEGLLARARTAPQQALQGGDIRASSSRTPEAVDAALTPL